MFVNHPAADGAGLAMTRLRNRANATGVDLYVPKAPVSLLVLLLGCSGAAAQAGMARPSTTGSGKRSTAPQCSAGKQVEVRKTGETFGSDGTHHVYEIIENGQPKFPLGATDVWVTDLNGDGADDLALLVRDTCGSGGCMYGVYVNCGGSRYIAVLEPAYTGELRLAKSSTHLPSGEWWRDLEDEHTVDYRGDDGALHQRLEVRILRFDGTRYQRYP